MLQAKNSKPGLSRSAGEENQKAVASVTETGDQPP